MRKFIFLILLSGLGTAAHAQKTQSILKNNKVTKLFIISMDRLMDTLSARYGLDIIYEREALENMHLVEDFVNDPVGYVLSFACKQHKLKYWIETDGTIYILQNTDDLARLKKIKEQRDIQAIMKRPPIAAPDLVPRHFKFSITGKVTDQSTGGPLPMATVSVYKTDLSTTTNSDGLFTLFNVPADTCTVQVSYSGYQSDYIRLDATKISRSLEFSLLPALNSLNEVTVAGKKSGVMNTDSKKIGVLQLTPANLDKLPSLGEKDIMRAFQLMPGVGATNESSSGAYVRGGTPDQNLVVFDGFTIYQVDHLYGFFSAFNANAVKDVSLYKGGFSSQFGGRLSSVTEINGKDGNRKETSIGGEIGLLSLNLYAELPVNKKLSFLMAFRRSYQGPFYDKIFKQFNRSVATTAAAPAGFGGRGGPPGGGRFGQQTTPASNFYDFDTKYSYNVNTNNIISWSLYAGADKTDNGRELQIPSFLASSLADSKITDYTKYGNLGSSIRWSSQIGKQLHANTYLTYSSYFNDRDRTSTGTSKNSYGLSTTFNSGTVEKNNLSDIGFKSEWTWQMNDQLEWHYGGFGASQKVNYSYVQDDVQTIDQHNKALSGGGYVELSITPAGKLHFQPGVRATFFDPTGKVYPEPRLSASYQMTDQLTFKAATGRFYQFMSQVTREDILNGNRYFWALGNNTNVPVSSANHFMGGAAYETDALLFNVEAYYKTLNGLSQYSIRTPAQTRGGGVPGGTTTVQNFYTGSGRAYGMEFMVQKKMGKYTGWVSYTLARAEQKFEVYGDFYYPADHDVTHEFKSINMYHHNRWNFSAVFIFSTGHPYTAPLSSYTVTAPDGNTANYFNVSSKNGVRLPAYHRLDLSASYDLIRVSGNKVGSLGLSLFNVYGHKNVWYREYQLQNSQAILTDVSYLGFTPNLSFSLRFK